MDRTRQYYDQQIEEANQHVQEAASFDKLVNSLDTIYLSHRALMKEKNAVDNVLEQLDSKVIQPIVHQTNELTNIKASMMVYIERQKENMRRWENLSNRIEEKTQSLRHKISEKESLDAEIEEAIRRLQEDYDKQEASLKEWLKELDAMDREKQQILSTKNQLEQSLSSIQANRTACEKRTENIEKQRNGLENIEQKVVDDLKSIQYRQEKHNEQVISLKEDIHQQETILNEYKAKLSSLENEMKKIQGANKSKMKAIREISKLNQSLFTTTRVDELKSLKTTLESSELPATSKDKYLKLVEEMIHDVMETTEMSHQVITLDHSAHDSNTKQSAALELLRDLQSKLAEKESHISHDRSSIEYMRSQIQSIEEASKQAALHLDKLRSKRQKDSHDYSQYHARLQDSVNKRQQQIASLTSSIRSLTQAIASSRPKQDQLHQEIVQKEKHIATIEQSLEPSSMLDDTLRTLQKEKNMLQSDLQASNVGALQQQLAQLEALATLAASLQDAFDRSKDSLAAQRDAALAKARQQACTSRLGDWSSILLPNV